MRSQNSFVGNEKSNYIVIMETQLIQIGNSRGIRLPKALIEQIGLGDKVELRVENGKIIIGPLNQPRKNWDNAFKMMAEAGDDQLLDSDIATHSSQWDDSEWKW